MQCDSSAVSLTCKLTMQELYQPGLLSLEVWATNGGAVEQLSQMDKVAGQSLQWPSNHTALSVPGFREVGEDLWMEEGGEYLDPEGREGWFEI